jgi:arginase family enzyme
MNNNVPYKLFGVALDASDNPFSLQLKDAAMDAQEDGVGGVTADPYDALFPDLTTGTGVLPSGKLFVPSWLGALPQTCDRKLVTRERMQRFVDEGGIRTLSKKVKDFVICRILPAHPVMVGIDHAATASVVSALTERLGPENLTVLVLDRHFDALPLSVRMAAFVDDVYNNPAALNRCIGDDAYCCGNFWASLIADGVVDPRHLVFVGVADYPTMNIDPKWEKFREDYLAYEKQGCRFFPLQAFTGNYGPILRDFLMDAISTPYLYVSLDFDVGSYPAVHAARYMDGPGIDKDTLLEVAAILAQQGHSGTLTLAGLDVMEFNMHFLGLETKAGERDQTLETVVAFVKTLVGGWRPPDSGSAHFPKKGDGKPDRAFERRHNENQYDHRS